MAVERLSEHPEWLESTRGLLRDYILLPDAWEDFGMQPTDALAFLEAEIREFPAPAIPPRGEVLVGETGGLLVAIGEIVPLDEETCELRRVYVMPDVQRIGIGRSIATGLLDEARTLGYVSAVLDVLPSRTGAQRFWRSMGFTEASPFRDSPFSMVYLGRSLDAGA